MILMISNRMCVSLSVPNDLANRLTYMFLFFNVCSYLLVLGRFITILVEGTTTPQENLPLEITPPKNLVGVAAS